MAQNPQQQTPAERQLEEQALRDRMGEIKFKLLVLSGKGGVGKSTVAANLAVALSDAGSNVGLLDVDIHGPSIPKLMGLENRQLGMDGQNILPIQIKDSLKVMSIGFLLSRDTDAVIWRGPLKFNAIRQFLKDVYCRRSAVCFILQQSFAYGCRDCGKYERIRLPEVW